MVPRVIYRYSGSPSSVACDEVREVMQASSHAGNIVVRSASTADLCLEAAIDHPLRLTHFTTRDAAEVTWRRSADLIRARGGAFVLFRFLERGSARIVTSGETILLNQGRFSVTRGEVPYLSQTRPDATGVHESFQIWVPLHRVAHCLPEEAFTGTFSRETPTGKIAGTLMRTLFDQGEHIDFVVLDRLVDALIAALVACIHKEREVRLPRGSVAKARLATMTDYIAKHAVRTDLTAAIVAEECGVSRRYMSSLFAREGLHFADLLREARLSHAESLLTAEDAVNRTVGEIARMSGFHSASYFSRVFKAVRGRSPRRFRVEQRDVLARTAADAVEEPSWRDLERPLRFHQGSC